MVVTDTTASNGGRQRRPSMTDVAALAGVSYQTVSRVINEQPGVRSTTRTRVHAAMEALDYHPNSLARSLVSGRSRAIGVISPSSDLFGPNRTLHTVDDAVREAGYTTVIANVPRLDLRGMVDGSRQLRSRAVDGIVIAGSPHREARDCALDLARQLPVVVIGRADVRVPTVDTDARAGHARLFVTFWPSVTRTCGTSAGPRTGPPRGSGWTGGGRSWPHTASPHHHHCRRVTGLLRRDTRPGLSSGGRKT